MSIAKAETRQRAIKAYLNQQGTQAQIAAIYGVNLRTFQRWLFRYQQTGVAAPLARGHRHAAYEGAALVRLDKLVQRHTDATLAELRALTSAQGSIMAVHRALERLGYRYKKKRCTPASKSVRRSACCATHGRQALPTREATRRVFIDESGAQTNMTCLRGRARKGVRLLAQAPQGHWGTTTLIAALRLNGQTAAMEAPGPANGTVFREYVEHVLVPSLEPGDVVIMDKLQTHHDGEALRRITACGASVQFLPPYSPDFNPIEKMGARSKTFCGDWRRAQGRNCPKRSRRLSGR